MISNELKNSVLRLQIGDEKVFPIFTRLRLPGMNDASMDPLG